MTIYLKITQTSFFELLLKPLNFFSKLRSGNIAVFILLLILGTFWLTLSSHLNAPGNYYLKWAQILISALICWVIVCLYLYMYAVVAVLISRLLEGKGTVKSTYTVLVYSFLPSIFLVSIYLLTFLFPMDGEYSPNRPFTKGLLIAVNAVVHIWSFYIAINGIRHFHKLSVLKSLLVSLGALLVPGILLFPAFILFGALF